MLKVAEEAQAALADRQIPLQVAVMSCVVNGPGEAREADLGIAAGRRKGHLCVKGRNVAVVPEADMVDELVRWADLIVNQGMDAALAQADPGAAAQADARSLADARGSDPNGTHQRIELMGRRSHDGD